MNSDTQLKVQAYLDNELSPGEARQWAAVLSSDPRARELYQELRATKELLSGNEPEVKLEESREFYWSKIRRQIEHAEREPAPRAKTWWIRLLAPLAGTAALFALLMAVANNGGRAPLIAEAAARPLHGEVEDLAPAYSSITFRSEQEGVTVVWLSARE